MAVVTFSTIITSTFFVFGFMMRFTGQWESKNRPDNDSESEDENETEEEVPYTSLYPLKDATDNRHVKGKLERYFLIENTPDGIVIMMYDPSRESFVYWGDKTSIPYNVLETVARKFVTTYECKNIYIERVDPSKKEETTTTTETDETTTTETEETTTTETTNEQPQQDSDDDVFVKKKTNVSSKKGLSAAVKANSYLRLGKVHDFKPIPEKKLENNIDFKTFMLNNNPLTTL